MISESMSTISMSTVSLSTLVAISVFTSGSLAGQLYLQDFSAQGDGYSTSIAEFSDGGTDFFTQSAANSVSSSVVYNGADGDYFAGMDIDGEGASLPVFLTTATFGIAGATDLQFMVDLAEDDDGSNQDWDAPDFVNFEYQVDGGSWVTIFTAINDGSTFNSAAFVDGVEITDTFATFSADLTGVSGTDMALRISWDLNAGDEDLAIDNLTITGNTVAVVPVPSAALAGIIVLGGLGVGRRIRR